jgi:heme/copper-type cytochrome/quinol oxidase subunit 2
MLDYTRVTRRNYWLRNEQSKKEITSSLLMTKLISLINLEFVISSFNLFKFTKPVIRKMKSYSFNNKHVFQANSFKHSSVLEWFFFSIPSITVLKIIVPSLALLCETDTEVFDPDLQVKIQGSQWYWSYDIILDF